jgi:hypothetical protein
VIPERTFCPYGTLDGFLVNVVLLGDCGCCFCSADILPTLLSVLVSASSALFFLRAVVSAADQERAMIGRKKLWGF